MLKVIEFRPVFSKSRSIYLAVTAQLSTEIARLILVIESTVAKVDVAVSARTISLAPRNMLRSTSPKINSLDYILITAQLVDSVTYGMGTF